MAQTIIYILLFLAILVQRSACLSWAIEPSDTGSLASQSDASSASVPFSPGKGVSALPTIIPAPGASSVHISGYTDVGGQGSVYNFPQSTVLRPGPPDGGGSTSSELVLTGTRTFSASSQIFIGDTQTSTSASITVIVLPATPSTSDGVAISLPVSPITATTSSDALPIPPFPSTSSPSSQFPTSTFGNDVHASATLSPSTSIFTASTSYSIFTTNGRLTSTAIPILSTSVTFVPVPTHTSTEAASKSSGPSTSLAVGIALGGVAIFLVLVLLYIINRRRKIRQRAFLRLGEDF